MSNVNLNNIVNSGNTGKIAQFPTLGVLRAIVLVPTGTIIPAADMVSPSVFATYVAGKFIANSRSTRWFAFTELDKFTDESKKAATEDTGRLQLEVYNFPPKFSFRYMQGMGNFIEANAFQNCQGEYDFFFIDDQGNWWGTVDSTGAGGLQAYTNQQFFIPNRGMHTVAADNAYMISVSLSDPAQINANFACYEAGTSPDAIVMLENAVVTDVTATLGTPLSITATTDIVVTVKEGQESTDFVKAYQSALTAPCFLAYNLTTATTLTIASIQKGVIIVAGQTYYYVWITLSAAPTATNLVQITLTTPSALNAIIPNANVVVEIVNPGANGQNAAVHTF